MFNKDEIDNIVKNTINDNKMNKISDNMYLSNRQIDILDRYKIDYKKFSNIKSLIFEIEQIINDDYDYIESNELDQLSQELSEFNYYYNVNK